MIVTNEKKKTHRGCEWPITAKGTIKVIDSTKRKTLTPIVGLRSFASPSSCGLPAAARTVLEAPLVWLVGVNADAVLARKAKRATVLMVSNV